MDVISQMVLHEFPLTKKTLGTKQPVATLLCPVIYELSHAFTDSRLDISTPWYVRKL